MSIADVVVVGAGPYGLSAAAHLRAIKGLDVRVQGEPMSFWEQHMPIGMLLRSPYVASHLSDPERALSAAVMTNGKPATQAIFEDRKLQRELKQTASALRDASSALRKPPKRRRRGGIGGSLLLIAIAGLLALALNEGLRSKVLDLLFGAEEEFDYSSTTAPSEPAPAGTPTS